MSITVRAYEERDLVSMKRIWNEIVEEGISFPQMDILTAETAKIFFAEQTYCGVAVEMETEEIVGLYILHPNNIGRCAHICNASYGVDQTKRGMHIGEKLVTDCKLQGKRHGFKILQFNAVVSTNIHARHLYERLGFLQLGVIPGGFLMKDGSYADICPYYCVL